MAAEFERMVMFRKGAERYSLRYDDDREGEGARRALRALGLWASNPELSFTWADAAYLAAKIRKDAPADIELGEMEL